MAFEPGVSVIIPFCNEENNLLKLLASIRQIAYNKVDFLLVDDHSTDRGREIVKGFIKKDDRLQLLTLPAGLSGKKRAVQWGVDHAVNEIIATTDADCELPPTWPGSLIRPFRDKHVQMVAGPVTGNGEQGFFRYFAELDLLSLVGTGLGAIGAGRPMYCNAANMAFRRGAYGAYVQSKLGHQSASGDDVFLLHYISHHYGTMAVKPVIDKQCTVRTRLPGGMRKFLRQRIRWASKSIYYTDYFTMIVAVCVFVVNVNLFIAFLAGLVAGHWLFFVVSFMGKSAIDLMFFTVILGFFNKRSLLSLVIIYQLFYSLYITFMPPLAVLLRRPAWKA